MAVRLCEFESHLGHFIVSGNKSFDLFPFFLSHSACARYRAQAQWVKHERVPAAHLGCGCAGMSTVPMRGIAHRHNGLSVRECLRHIWDEGVPGCPQCLRAVSRAGAMG